MDRLHAVRAFVYPVGLTRCIIEKLTFDLELFHFLFEKLCHDSLSNQTEVGMKLQCESANSIKQRYRKPKNAYETNIDIGSPAENAASRPHEQRWYRLKYRAVTLIGRVGG